MVGKKRNIKCAQCGKELGDLDFKIKSLFIKDAYVCEDCAIKEDEEWLNNTSLELTPEYQ